jgi:polar amino acid transport system substrate-binding protein
MVESEDAGVFIELLKEIEKRIGKNFAVQILPPKRAHKYFQEGQLIGIFPSVFPCFAKKTGADTPCSIEAANSAPFYMKREFIFFRKQVPYMNIKDLQGKRVGLTLGYTYTDELLKNPNISFEYARGDVNNIMKLSLGRIDAFVVEEFSGIKAVQISGAENIAYNRDAPLYSRKVYFSFQPSESGRILQKRFSDAIKEIKKDGTLKKILDVSDEWIKSISEN